ncbi:MAG: tyrosine-type recombinase/integrase [Archaeoglobus sp.]|uniref:tyrosine-type recombinase/integrase n=1 Tax=Archaeoglobus sp. TaxID=1872626 RepID=UPI001DF5DA0D|nr:tyrosine-type recombinase/integrase [Archaeoglobus sp.]MBO8180481.1 tyrosine-type recombinase/integrase [Archaeoglobus sp.]
MQSIKNEELKQLAEEFLSRYKNKETRRGFEGPIRTLLKELNGQDLDRSFMISFRDKWRYEPYGETLFKKLKVFFNWLKEKKPELAAEIEDWRNMLKWEGKKKKQLFSEMTKDVKWLQNVIDKILSLKIKKEKLNDTFAKLRFLTAVVLQATTGMRPFELKKLTWKHLEDFEDRAYFILPHEISKTPFDRVQPLTDEAKWLLKELRAAWNRHAKKLQLKGDVIFPYKESRKVIDLLKKEGVDFTQEDLRDFATTMSTNILGVPPALEAAIAGHQTDKWKLELESYIHMHPKDLAAEYLKFWNNVKILTDRQKKHVEKIKENF